MQLDFHKDRSNPGNGPRTFLDPVQSLAVYEHMAEGVSFCEIITDDDGAPSDFRFLDVNPAFARMFLHSRALIRGKRGSEVTRPGAQGMAEIYGRVARTGKPESFERYCPELKRWCSVNVCRAAPGVLAAIYTDTTAIKAAESAYERSVRRHEILSGAASILLECNSPKVAAETLCSKVMDFLDCQVFFNYLMDEQAGRLRLNAYAGIPEEEARAIEWLDIGEAVCGSVARSGRAIIETDIHGSRKEYTRRVRSYGVQAYCCHPLMTQGKVTGALSFGSRTRERFSRDDIQVMAAVTDMVAVAMHRMRTEAALRESEAKLATEKNALVRLDEVGLRLWRSASLGEGLNEMLAASIELLGADMGCVQLFDAGRKALVIAAHSGFSQDFLDFFKEVRADECTACGKALRHGAQTVVEDVETDPGFEPIRNRMRAAGIRAVQSSPLTSRDGECMGMLCTHFRTPHRPDPHTLRLMDLYARKAAGFIERCSMEEALRESEERLRAVMYALPAGVCVLDAAGEDIVSNAAFEQIWGGPRPEVKSITDTGQYKAWRLDTGERLAAEDWASSRAIQHGETVVGQLLRIETFDGRTIYVNNSAAPVHDAEGRPAGAAVAIVDITSQVETHEALRRSQEHLKQAQSMGNIGSWRLDIRKNLLTCSEEMHHIFGVPLGTRPAYETLLALVHPDDRVHVEPARVAALDDRPREVEYRVAAGGEEKWVRGRAVGELGPGGELIGAFGVCQDITERKRKEQQIQLLLREMNHRAKNMLALVQAIALQTAAESVDEFKERFSGRIVALGASQDLLVRGQWSVDMEALARSQLAHFDGLTGNRITLKGYPLRLSAQACQAFGMALHELATNAGKYGALSGEDGEVFITWRIEGRGSGARFVLEWIERGGPPVTPPERRGFGHTVTVAMPKLELDADVSLEYERQGLQWRLSCPVEKVLDCGNRRNC